MFIRSLILAGILTTIGAVGQVLFPAGLSAITVLFSVQFALFYWSERCAYRQGAARALARWKSRLSPCREAPLHNSATYQASWDGKEIHQ